MGVPATIDGYVILIVEDNPIVLDLLANAFAHEGSIPLTAASGREALEAVAHNLPDVILLDLQLPAVSGLDVALELRTKGIDVSIVVMTAAPGGRVWAE